jgi:hypothetical protein
MCITGHFPTERDTDNPFQSNPKKSFDNAPPPQSKTMKLRMHDLMRQFGAEVLGTFLLVLFGDAAIAQVALFILIF